MTFEAWLELEINRISELANTDDTIARAFFSGQYFALKHVLDELKNNE